MYIFFRKAVMRKLFDIRFSYKHYNFSHVLATHQDGVENRDKVYFVFRKFKYRFQTCRILSQE